MIPFKEMTAVKNIFEVDFRRVKLTDGKDFCDFLIKHKAKRLEIDNVDITGVRDTAVKFGELFSKTSINYLHLNNIKSPEEAHFWLKSLPETVENVWLNFQEDVPLAERLKIARAAVRYVPNTVKLDVLNNQTKLDLETILYVALRPSLGNLSFCNLEVKAKWIKKAIEYAKIAHPDVVMNMLLAFEKCSSLPDQYKNVDFFASVLTRVMKLQDECPSMDEADFIVATQEFRETVEKAWCTDNIKTCDDFMRIIQRAYVAMTRTIIEISNKKLEEILKAAQL